MTTAFIRRWPWMVSFVAAAIATLAIPELYEQAIADDAPQAAAASGGELRNVAVIAGAPYDKLISDVSFLGSLAGKPELGQMVEGGIAFFTQGKAATAIDKKQAWGVIVQTDGANFMPVGCLPVVKGDDLLEVVKNYGAEIKDSVSGAKEVVLPNRRSVFVKQENGMAFISTSAASLARLPANPKQLLTKMVGEYDLTAHISVKNVPEMYRQFALQAMQAGVRQGMKQKDDETDEQYAARQKMTQAQMAQMEQMINEIDSVTFGWAVDSQQQRTYADFTYKFMPDSKMAKQLSAYSAPKTDFAGFYQPDAAATLTFSMKSDPQLMAENMAQFEASMNSAREQMNREIDKKVDDAEAREALKAAMADWFDAFAATIKSGQMDGGASLQLSPDSLTFVAGATWPTLQRSKADSRSWKPQPRSRQTFPALTGKRRAMAV